MFHLYKHSCPAIACPVTGEVVVVYPDTAAGWSRCMSLLREVQADLAKERQS
jgi:hypothetical protein